MQSLEMFGVSIFLYLVLMPDTIEAGQSLNQGQQRTRNFFPIQVDSGAWIPDPLIPPMTVEFLKTSKI